MVTRQHGGRNSHQIFIDFIDKGKRLDDGEECVSVDRVLADICENGSRPYHIPLLK